MTTPTSMGNHGGTVTSCSPYAYPGFAEICILLRTWSTVTPGTCELAFLIKKKKNLPLTKNPNCVYPSDCLLAGSGTDWLTVNLSSRCTAEGNRIWV